MMWFAETCESLTVESPAVRSGFHGGEGDWGPIGAPYLQPSSFLPALSHIISAEVIGNKFNITDSSHQLVFAIQVTLL